MSIRKIPKDTNTFRYYNANPFDRRTGDCVMRALSLVLQKKWETVCEELFKLSMQTGYSMNSRESIELYLKEKGYEKQKQPRKANGKKYTGSEFARLHPNGRYLLSIGALHITALSDGKITDIWDCSDRCVGNYWIIKD